MLTKDKKVGLKKFGLTSTNNQPQIFFRYQDTAVHLQVLNLLFQFFSFTVYHQIRREHHEEFFFKDKTEQH